MAAYTLSTIQTQYPASANPPVLDRVTFTIDHIHAGSNTISGTYEVVKFLVDNGIPVTVFMQATSPSNNYEFDRTNASLIYGLAPHLVTLGVHPLSSGNSQSEQTKVYNIISQIIVDVTGSKPLTLSYHGSGAGPEPGISYPGIKYARGIGSTWSPGTDNRLDTPVVVMNSVQRAFDYTSERNSAGLSSTIFVHTQELLNGSLKKDIFDAFIKNVKAQKLQAVSYYDAMLVDFKDGTPSQGGGSGSGGSGGTTTPPSGGTTVKGSLRLSASESPSRRPLKANFKIESLSGETIATANNISSQQFSIPVGTYRVSATAAGTTKTETIELTQAKGIHHIFLISTSGGSTPTPPTPPTPPVGGLGSLRLSASDKRTRRPVKADFLVQDLTGKVVDTAGNTSSHLFRIPAAPYQVSAIVGSNSVSNEILLTATQGIHHIFLIPEEGSGGSTPSPTPPTPSTPPVGEAFGSLRISASERQTRRPIKADFLIQDMSGKLIDTAANTQSHLFRIPAGQYQLKAQHGGNTVSTTINLTSTKGIHHIFLIPT